MPIFSIIVPTYNRAHTIKRCIDSIICQTFENWELIIVDDGSIDYTDKIVASYNDSRIHYVWQQNQERSAARNYGISLAKGDWICFQDSDDEYLPEHLEVLYGGIKENPEYKILRTGLLIYQGEKLLGKTSIRPINKYDQYPYECIHVFCFKSDILFDIRFSSDFITVEDFYFLFYISKKHKILHLTNFWTGKYFYDAHSSSGIGVNYERNLKYRIACMNSIIEDKNCKAIPYVYRQRILSELLLLYGHFKYQPKKIINSIIWNLKCFFKFPIEYLKLIIRIIFVKFGQFTNLYYTDYRF